MKRGTFKIFGFVLICFLMCAFIQGRISTKVDKQKQVTPIKDLQLALAELHFLNDVKIVIRDQPTSWFFNFEGHYENSGNVAANGVRLLVEIRKVKNPNTIRPTLSTRIIKKFGPVFWPSIPKKTTVLLGFGSALPKSFGKGKYSATLILDPDKTIPELNENNNKKVLILKLN